MARRRGKRASKTAVDLRTQLRKALDKYGLNVHRFATITGLPSDVIRKIASGESTDPQVYTVEQVADVLDYDVKLVPRRKAERKNAIVSAVAAHETGTRGES